MQGSEHSGCRRFSCFLLLPSDAAFLVLLAGTGAPHTPNTGGCSPALPGWGWCQGGSLLGGEDRTRSGTGTQPQCWGGASFTPTCVLVHCMHAPTVLPATPPRLSIWECICKRGNSHERVIFPPYFSFSLKKNGQLSKKCKLHFFLNEQQAGFRAVFKILLVSSSRALSAHYKLGCLMFKLRLAGSNCSVSARRAAALQRGAGAVALR